MEANSGSDDPDPDGSCLICHSKISLSNTTTTTGQDYFDHPLNPKLLLKDLQTYFLLKHILGISSEQIQGYLRHCPYPGDWVKVCSLCTETYVNSCTRTFLELQEARRKYRVSREQLIEAVKKSVENETESQEPFTLDICREVRKSVAHVPVNKYKLGKDGLENSSSVQENKDGQTSGIHLSTPAKEGTDDDVDFVKVEAPEEEYHLYDDAINDIFENAVENWDENPEKADELNEYSGDSESSDESYIPEGSRRTTSAPRRKRRNVKVKVVETKTFSNSTPATGDEDSIDLSELTCHICCKVLAHPNHLKRHLKECHEGDFHRCPEEGCTWKTRRPFDLKLHMKRRHGSLQDILDLTCPVCNKIFSKKSRLVNHLDRGHGDTAPNIVCDKCDKKFIDETGLKSHLAVVHNVKKYQIHACTYVNCFRAFYRKCDLNSHLQNHQGLKCDICLKNFKSTKGLKTHMQGHKMRMALPFQCSLCPMRFPQRLDLIRHKKLRHPFKAKDRKSLKMERTTGNEDKAEKLNDDCSEGDNDDGWNSDNKNLEEDELSDTTGAVSNMNEHACDICPKTFAHSDNLRKHISECHGKVFHRCPEKGCTWKGSRRSYDVKNHMRRHHGTKEDLKDLTCHLCSKVFSKKSHLNYHMTHSKEHSTGPSISCEKCDKEFFDETGLKSHQAMVHDMKEYQTHLCTYENCGKGFFRRCQLLLHLQKHLGLTCEICGKGFKSSKRMEGHKEGHVTSSPTSVQCPLCTTSVVFFVKRVDLLRHKKLKHGALDPAEEKEGNDEMASDDEETSEDESGEDDDWSAGDSEASTQKVKRKRRRKGTTKIPGEKKPTTRTVFPIEFIGENGAIQYRCEHEGCPKIMLNPRYYKQHLTAKHGSPQEMHCCHICGKGFSQENFVRLHIRAAHDKKLKNGRSKTRKVEEPQKCELCDTVLKTKASMDRHMRRTHTKNFQYYCEHCGKGTLNQSCLRYHRAQFHFICAVEDCGLPCKDRQEVWTHHKEVHNTQLGVFGCDECGKLMIDKRKWRNHLQLHEVKRRRQEQSTEDGVGASGVGGEFVCDLCGMQFPVKDYLSNHIARVHHGKYRNKSKKPKTPKENPGGENNQETVKEEN